MFNIVHQFISSVVCIRLPLSYHTQLDGHILFPMGKEVLWSLQATVSAQVAFATEQVCLIFSSPFSLFPPQVAAVQRQCSRAGEDRTGTPGFEQGKEQEDMKTNAKRLLSLFGSRSVQKTAAFYILPPNAWAERNAHVRVPYTKNVFLRRSLK